MLAVIVAAYCHIPYYWPTLFRKSKIMLEDWRTSNPYAYIPFDLFIMQENVSHGNKIWSIFAALPQIDTTQVSSVYVNWCANIFYYWGCTIQRYVWTLFTRLLLQHTRLIQLRFDFCSSEEKGFTQLGFTWMGIVVVVKNWVHSSKLWATQ